MGRWQEDAGGRLREAALQLYVERGYEQTTVADIAQRAGLTARTFFRHFGDKREVLFAGSQLLREGMVKAVAEAPADLPPLDAVAAALDAAAGYLGRDREFSRLRRSVVDANPELLERELIKLATLATALAAALRDRGVPDPDAALAAEAGIVVLRVAFDRWVATADGPPLPDLMRTTLTHLRAVTATTRP